MMKDKHKKRIVLYAVMTLAVMAFIFIISAQDGDTSGDLSKGFLASLVGRLLEKILPRLSDQGAAYDIRKKAHMCEYLCLGASSALLAYEALLFRRGRPAAAPLAALLFCFLYACSDEWHQTFVPGRAGLFSDVLIDSAGYLAGIGLIAGINLGKRLDKRND
ncbi:MAG: VanZ family protein [Oscillospiraceae bacterium]|nr:VanZ family protein [Oscillospiraceae bacterium]